MEQNSTSNCSSNQPLLLPLRGNNLLVGCNKWAVLYFDFDLTVAFDTSFNFFKRMLMGVSRLYLFQFNGRYFIPKHDIAVMHLSEVRTMVLD